MVAYSGLRISGWDRSANNTNLREIEPTYSRRLALFADFDSALTTKIKPWLSKCVLWYYEALYTLRHVSLVLYSFPDTEQAINGFLMR
ncbi:MAG: hypothetical protein ABI901_13465, partial [Roseiflexaceae bacterium]